MENGKFKEEYLKVEKENLSKIIKSKIDDKDLYAYETCISKMYGDNGFGLYKYGYLEDLENITVENLTEHYNNLIQNSKMDIFISGDFDEKYIIEQKITNIEVNYKEAEEIAEKFHIKDINFIKPGIGETTRVLLRRVPWKILVKNKTEKIYIGHILELAKEKGITVEEYPLKYYRACGLIKNLNADI